MSSRRRCGVRRRLNKSSTQGCREICRRRTYPLLTLDSKLQHCLVRNHLHGFRVPRTSAIRSQPEAPSTVIYFARETAQRLCLASALAVVARPKVPSPRAPCITHKARASQGPHLSGFHAAADAIETTARRIGPYASSCSDEIVGGLLAQSQKV